MTNWDDEGEETKKEENARLGTIYEALLIIIFIGVPIAMILLRCFTLKNIRKLDLFFLFFAITFWFWIIWWSFLLYHGLNQWATFRGKKKLPAQWERICVWRISLSNYLSQLLKRPVWRNISTWCSKLSLIQKYKLRRTSKDEIELFIKSNLSLESDLRLFNWLINLNVPQIGTPVAFAGWLSALWSL